MDGKELLTALMKRHGDTPTSLSKKTNNATKQPQIYKYLNQQVGEPRRETLRPVAKVYGIPVEAFYEPSIASTVAQNLGISDAAIRGVGTSPPISDNDRLPDVRYAPPPKSQALQVTGMLRLNRDGGVIALERRQGDGAFVTVAGCDATCYALQVLGDGPGIIQHGFVLVLSTERELKPHSLVLVALRDGGLHIKRLLGLDRETLTLGSPSTDQTSTVLKQDVEYVHCVINIIPS